MSVESANTFIERIKADKELAKKVTACKDAETRMAFLQEAGFDFSANEIKQAVLELTNDELDMISGGTSKVAQSDVPDN
ncbi:MAG: Nif11-like leader peptide family natural product precursor [Syntrophomonas sp.]